MKFTDHFISLPTKEYNQNEAALTGIKKYRDSYLKVCPTEISNYRPCIDYENENGGKAFVAVTLKNGDNFWTYVTLEEFENILNKHQYPLQWNSIN